MRDTDTSYPILVTGSHRSGTTWVGRALSLGDEAEPIHEPFNPATYNSWMRTPPSRWFWYVDPETAGGPTHDDVAMVLSMRPAFVPMLRRADRLRARGGAVREQLRAAQARLAGRRPLLKDPIAFFSAEWLAQQFDVRPLVLVRHPAAFASSLKRLNWTFDFHNLSEQPELISRYLGPFREEIRAASVSSLDIIGQAILVWRLLNHVALRYREDHPTWVVRRYEDLAVDPTSAFQDLYGRLDLRWTPTVERRLWAMTSQRNGAGVADGDRGGVRRDSRAAMWTWTSRLTGAEIERVRIGTADVAQAWYTEDDWRPPVVDEPVPDR